MQVELFDYELPAAAIAQTPVEPRDASRLLVLDRAVGGVAHRQFHDLPAFLTPRDLLVINDSRVIPARLFGRRNHPSGASLEVLLLRQTAPDRWEALIKPGRRAPVGTHIIFGRGELTAEVVAVTEFGGGVIFFSYEGDWRALLHSLGRMPLPPYIHTPLAEAERYQTVYARQEGSVAAPTAGLHFTERLLAELAGRGVRISRLTLHVGLGTFRPVETERVEEHRMHEEFFTLPRETAAAVAETKAAGGRVIAVGTTAVRTLESAVDADGKLAAGSQWTKIFIYPGYTFQAVDAMITNFHLPRSTLLMLVSAFAGRETILAAYRLALAQGYRFFSFGDAMLIL